MKLNRRTLDKIKDRNTTVISEGIELKGKVKGADNFIFYGELKGNIELTGSMLVGPNGRFSGEINAHDVIIEGDVESTVNTTEKVEIRDGRKIQG